MYMLLRALGVVIALLCSVVLVPFAAPAAEKPRQMRGVWIATAYNLDWPSSPGLSAQAQQNEFRSLLDNVVSWGLNTVFVQVRSNADALWEGSAESWPAILTGQRGVHPGYDPLAFMVEEAHRRGIEFHAWFNPYRIASAQKFSTLPSTHPARTHPDWVMEYAGTMYYNPGVPEARAYVVNTVADVAQRYDIDGVHFDDYFYPYPKKGVPINDSAQFAAYGGGLSLSAWRWENINALVREVHQRLQGLDRKVQFGVSPFAVWRNQSTDPSGSATRAGVQTFDDLYADTRAWVWKGWIDYIVPQVYWGLNFAPARYETLVSWWASVVRDTAVELYIGEAAYKVGTSAQSPGWSRREELADHVRVASRYPEVVGHVFFRIGSLRANQLGGWGYCVSEYYHST